METSYLTFSTDFPAVIVCEWDNDEHISDMMNKKMGKHVYDLDEVYKEITYFHGQAHFTKDACFTAKSKRSVAQLCPMEGLAEIAAEFHVPCEEALFNCTWNGVLFPCCEQFLPLQTEMGLCYAINSMQTDHLAYKAAPLNMASNISTGPGRLYFETSVPAVVYVLATQEVPTLNTPEHQNFLLQKKTRTRRWYNVREVENDRGVHELSVRQRQCRFPYENQDDSSYPYYSYSTCVVQCRKQAQLDLCNCTSHQMPNHNPNEVCGLSGIVCISDNYKFLSILRNKNSFKKALLCQCDLSCEDQVITRTLGTLNKEDKDIAALEIRMESLPHERYKRNVVRGYLDMVVSTGGAAGLLVGASLLSFVEILYHFTVRLYCNHCRKSNKEKKKPQNSYFFYN